jgi:hypothetical protein
MDKTLFVPFSKVDVVKREVSGIVTAELPDKDREVCDYEKSKPYYKAWSDEFRKATDGASIGNLREMHQLSAVGKAIDLQFNDSDKEIIMTFKVSDDQAWKKVEDRTYTGFSQGGRKVGDQYPDPVHKGCMRYVANPSEVSLVDNPCLPQAHFAFIRADGVVEMRKFLKTEASTDPARIDALEKAVSALKAGKTIEADIAAMIDKQPYDTAQVVDLQNDGPVDAAKDKDKSKAAMVKETKTKRVAGKDLHASAFAYVGDPEKTETWKLPVHDAAHARNALARFNQTKGIPSSAKAKVKAKIVSAAKKFGIDVASENDKIAAIRDTLRKGIRICVNANFEKIRSQHLLDLDNDLGKLAKGMYEVSFLAENLDRFCRLLYAVCNEQEWEGDEDSQLPDMLSENLIDMAATLVAMVNEETSEMVDEVRMHVA